MRITDIFVKRPVLATVVSLVILIAGLQSIRSLSVRQYPRSDIAVVRVSTIYVGADADLVRGFITTPLERVIASADGIDYMESSSAQGLSTITVHLHLNYDTNAALTQIQAKVAQVRNDLPPEAEAPIIELETADNQFAAVYLSFSSVGPRSEPDYGLSDAGRSTAIERRQRRTAGRYSRQSYVRHADLAQARQDDGARHLPVCIERGVSAKQSLVGARSDERLYGVGEPCRQYGPAHARGIPAARRQRRKRRCGAAWRRR